MNTRDIATGLIRLCVRVAYCEAGDCTPCTYILYSSVLQLADDQLKLRTVAVTAESTSVG